MAQIIKFPTRLRRKKKEIESEIQVAEEALKDYMEELDMLNKEIAHLTSLYEELVNELLQLELKEE
jgi:predicted  nucleic acid-binding Zn-ribbon protein